MKPAMIGIALACGLAGAEAGAQAQGLETPAGAKAYAFEEASVYAVIATPGRITDIILEPGESLTVPGGVAAGDTTRWIIGDTASGVGAERRVHVLIKPTAPDLATNLIINSDRRTYHLELRASARTWNSQVSWRYPPSPAAPAAPAAPVVVTPPPREAIDLSRINLDYRIEGDHPAWRPLRAFDDGRRTYVEFRADAALGDLPPLYVLGADGKTPELVNYHFDGRRMVIDRLIDRAELRLGGRKGAMRVRLVRSASTAEAGQ